jgi:hypothetical protein
MAKEADEFVEPRILSGLIVSTDFLRRVYPIWSDEYIQSPDVAMVAGWVWDYYDRYGEAPDKHIQDVYMERVRAGLADDRAQFVELMLERASKDFGRGEQFNSDYLFDQAQNYFRQRRLELHRQEIQELIDNGEITEAEQEAAQYTGLPDDLTPGLFLDSDEALQQVDQAFSDEAQRVVYYPGPLGEMLNTHLIRGGFVSFLAPEKRGKTWVLMDLAIRAVRQKANVAFFQAGDMTESQQIKRICTYLAKRPDEANMPPSPYYAPVKDCVYNQCDACDLDERESDFGPFEDHEPEEVRNLGYEDLKQAVEENPDYSPCHNCSQYEHNRWGAPWFKLVEFDHPLESEEAKRRLKEFFGNYASRFKLSTHPSGTLSLSGMQSLLDSWEREDGFVPDLILADYADLLAPEGGTDYRHQQNEIWKGLRSLSQDRHCLLVTATQADAKSYQKGRLGMSNFSEDKRKHAHVTAMFGLNQDTDGQEKRLGILRINEIVAREGDFSPDNEVKVLQALSMGRPFLGSFW